MLRVKICGITNLDDALYAVEAGADAIGFVFYTKSPRYISPENAAKIIDKLPPFVERVGLFVDHTAETINDICLSAHLSLAQVYNTDQHFCDQLNTRHIKVIRANDQSDILQCSGEYRLIDAFTEGYGGEGKRLPIEWFNDIDCSKIILAGGLNAENISAIKPYNFYGVDVSSGVEKSKGVKDQTLIKNFIKIAKEQ
ncbi:N-(5'-phosphoribosyl)anthranilate isomerase [Campylobacterota bacterium]|nr:N-(5'-phosphoribosyl)anthranilate isomerase [Campylobacterota bacterium]